jgi:hypothetical protein
MCREAIVGAVADRLIVKVNDTDWNDTPWADLQPMQIAAADERLRERIGSIKLLANRAHEGGVTAVHDMADIVPLLFAHTAYKTYPEAWFTQGKWDRMGQWLDTITTHRVRGVDTQDVNDLDTWIERLAAVGHFVSCSSGTTGKCSIIPSSAADRAFVRGQVAKACSWGTGIAPNRGYKMFSLSAIAANFRTFDARQSIVDAFAAADHPFPGPKITVGQINAMVALRRKIADGNARPAEIAAFQETAAQREQTMGDALKKTAEALVANRAEKILFQGMQATMFQIAEMVQAMGFSAKDFHPDNVLFTGGGLKGATLPPNFRERIRDTFNVVPERAYITYGMQEINTFMPICKARRYHVPPWTILLILDESGDRLIAPTDGEIEGRAAFFDLAIDDRWCGLISGDKVRASYGRCACGHHGPTIDPEIMRYSELPGGDKISCAGTIDAYIRGAA